ncbi:DUF952 domain-containing protein [Novosphingobium sp. ZW T3_23]|uniref:DUF952 domain-containing protein n=1 Tax=Novosphingobium sp. ZW T3_23 TaxID=3378084 RepID=UPI00385431F1
MTDRVAYKILTGEQLETLLSNGIFTGAPIDHADGYIHMSTATQAQETLDKHFAGQTGLGIAAVDLTALGDAVKWEVSRGGALFPHIYADLPLSAVIAHGPVERDAAGKLILPAS